MKLFSPLRLCNLLFALSVLSLSACGKSDTPSTSETANTGSMELVADEVLRPAIDSLIIGFSKENPHATVTVRYVSAGEAIQELLNKKARAIIVGRRLNALEQGLLAKYKLTLPDFDIAQQGIGCIVSAKNPLTALALSDLRGIMQNKITSWSQLRHSLVAGGKNSAGTVATYLPEYPSSIEYKLDSMFLQPNEMLQGHLTRYQTTDSVVRATAQNPSAIGFIGSAWKHLLETTHDSSVKLLPIIPADSSSLGIVQPIIMHLAYIYQGLYPLTSRVEGYSFENPNTLPRGFLAYAMTAHGQTVFKNFEVLPQTQIIKIVPAQ